MHAVVVNEPVALRIWLKCVCLFFIQGESFSHTVTAQHTSAKVEGLKSGTVYVVQVRARTVAGYGRYSNPVEISTSLYGKDIDALCLSHLFRPNM